MKIISILSIAIFSIGCSSQYCVYTNNKKKFVKVYRDAVDNYCPQTTSIGSEEFFLVEEKQ